MTDGSVKVPDALRQSLLARMAQCPHSVYLGMRHGDDGGSYAAHRGTAIHDVFERATRKIQQTGEIGVPGDVMRDLAQQVMGERKDLILPPKEQDAVRAMAWNWGEHHTIDLRTLVGVELAVELRVGNWIVRGKIDRLHLNGHDAAEVWDYKSSLVVPPHEDFSHAFQPQMYALLVTQGVWSEPSEYSSQEGLPPTLYGERVAPGIPGVICHEVYPRYVGTESSLVERTAYFDHARLADFAVTVGNLVEDFEHGLIENEWPAMAGSHCAFCPAPRECPIKARPVAPIEDHEGAAALAERHRVVEAEQKAIWAALRDWADEHGEIPYGSDIELGFTLVESEVVKDKDKLKAALAEGGADPREFYKARTSTRFGKRKVEK